MKTIFYFLTSIFSQATLAAPLVAVAGETRDIPIELSIRFFGPDKVADLAQYIGLVYQYFTGIAGMFAVVMVMYGGTKWIFAAGDAGKISAAKDIVTHAVIGLVLVLGSYLILNTVNPNLVRLKVPDVTSITGSQLQIGKCPIEKKYPCGKQFSVEEKGRVNLCMGQYCEAGGCFDDRKGTFVCVDAGSCPANCVAVNELAAVKQDPKKLEVLCASDACRQTIPSGCQLFFREGDREQPFCSSRLTAGQSACSSNENCAYGLICNFGEFPNTCRPAGGLAAGISCDDDRDCKSGICNKGFIRDQCAPEGGSPVGMVCDDDTDCGSEKGSGRVCNIAFTIDSCVALRSLGKGEDCDRDAICASGVCEGEEGDKDGDCT